MRTNAKYSFEHDNDDDDYFDDDVGYDDDDGYDDDQPAGGHPLGVL